MASVASTLKVELSEVEEVLMTSLATSSQLRFSASPEPVTDPATCQPTTADQASEKKTTKKRKSWGQELPTPTTNLPPRKRAKTEAEKEQRRIERVLRNRAAAQSSRERKRKEVEALEDVKNTLADDNDRLRSSNEELLSRVDEILTQNQLLQKEIQSLKAQLEAGGISYKSEIDTPSPFDILLTPHSMTHDSFTALSPSEISTPQPMDGTLDPSHLSTPSKSTEIDPFSLTQHTAVMLCSKDLPCQLTGRSIEMQVMLVLLNWILCLVASATSVDPIQRILKHLVNNQRIPHMESLRLLALSHLLPTILKTNQSLVSRLETLCPTSALPLDATSSVRGLRSGTTVLGSATGLDDNEDKTKKDGAPVGGSRQSERYMRAGVPIDWKLVVKQAMGSEEDLMVLSSNMAGAVNWRKESGFDLKDILPPGVVVGAA